MSSGTDIPSDDENTRIGWTEAAADPAYRDAVLELLGALAYGELSAFERLAEDARDAPDLTAKAEIAAHAAAEFGHFAVLRGRLAELDADVTEAMRPFAAPLDEFHRRTAPSSWLESLVKAFVGDAIATDFYREIARRLDDDTRGLVLATLGDTGHAEFAADRICAAIEEDPRQAGRLALWGRRLMGEALSQAQRVVADHDALAAVLAGGAGTAEGLDLAELGRLFARITEAHARRMQRLGLQP
ncbi:tRNA 2-methylthio-N6-isopentenyl adenosine(37) hydroxylase MiaE-like protein [Mangrovactinospora gilvigrisea]|uniref:tRNA 2-methylthio-N6-isopentenyl adenosine(37) hydroxylase MiaE-like protein n=1 Tax=Mangrovactinospora gilvigrisea TaxID=1428644 RepID=A0A1J7BEB4_9ACTN|nr:ferritin-like fold-containing protein [Mangrovactinospora gilvigrisea]OIV36917.1 tRNA 2-methylthio-N6-isopentenyl adenosine(37) hydroxylase MiaE-like protein [Mangrovactinospora gilvigrisea]